MSPRTNQKHQAIRQGRGVKTTIELPEAVWRAAKIRAVEDYTDLRTVVIAALGAYLRITIASDRHA
ncbi:MAG: hypothetical protein WCP29_02865 [Acidobacteriota bacterium]